MSFNASDILPLDKAEIIGASFVKKFYQVLLGGDLEILKQFYCSNATIQLRDANDNGVGSFSNRSTTSASDLTSIYVKQGLQNAFFDLSNGEFTVVPLFGGALAVNVSGSVRRIVQEKICDATFAQHFVLVPYDGAVNLTYFVLHDAITIGHNIPEKVKEEAKVPEKPKVAEKKEKLPEPVPTPVKVPEVPKVEQVVPVPPVETKAKRPSVKTDDYEFVEKVNEQHENGKGVAQPVKETLPPVEEAPAANVPKSWARVATSTPKAATMKPTPVQGRGEDATAKPTKPVPVEPKVKVDVPSMIEDNTVVVKKLEDRVSDENIKSTFSQFGSIKTYFRRHGGVAYVEYSNIEEAGKAVAPKRVTVDGVEAHVWPKAKEHFQPRSGFRGPKAK